MPSGPFLPSLFQQNLCPHLQRDNFVGNRDHKFERAVSKQWINRAIDSRLILGMGSVGIAANHGYLLSGSLTHLYFLNWVLLQVSKCSSLSSLLAQPIKFRPRVGNPPRGWVRNQRAELQSTHHHHPPLPPHTAPHLRGRLKNTWEWNTRDMDSYKNN